MQKQQTVTKLSNVLEDARSGGWADDDLRSCLEMESKCLLSAADREEAAFKTRSRICSSAYCFLFKFLPSMAALGLLLSALYNVSVGSSCLFLSLVPVREIMPPVINCDACRGMTEAPRLANLSHEDFIRHHAYQSKPFLVADAAMKWPALELFSYDYFKTIYLRSLDDETISENQFFSYSSNIANLKEFFELPDEIATMESERWYVAWPVSHPAILDELMKHISLPYFIPAGILDLSTPLIFMGAPGPGADRHIDTVENVVWQAQLSGTKTWTLTPPAECEHVCQAFNVTVHRGDIIVIETTSWYHETYVHPGNISITFGAHYT